MLPWKSENIRNYENSQTDTIFNPKVDRNKDSLKSLVSSRVVRNRRTRWGFSYTGPDVEKRTGEFQFEHDTTSPTPQGSGDCCCDTTLRQSFSRNRVVTVLPYPGRRTHVVVTPLPSRVHTNVKSPSCRYPNHTRTWSFRRPWSTPVHG